MIHRFILCMVLIMGVLAPSVQASLRTAPIKTVERGLAQLLGKAAREGTKDMTEVAARKLVKEAVKQSDEVAKLAAKYGEESLVHILRTSGARKICDELGTDGLQALIKHTNIAEKILSKTAAGGRIEVARTVEKMSTSSARKFSKLLDNMADGGEKCLEWITKHPRLSLTCAGIGGLGVLIMTNPTLSAIAGAMVSHPTISICIILLLAAAVWFIWRIYGPYLIAKLRRRFATDEKA